MLIYALRLADIGEGLQYRCVDGVGDRRRGHAASCVRWSLSCGNLLAPLGALCELLLTHALRVEFALLSVRLRASRSTPSY